MLNNFYRLLYDYFLYDISEKIKSSHIIVELGLECYLQIIKLVSSHYKKLDKFLIDSSEYAYYFNKLLFFLFFLIYKFN